MGERDRVGENCEVGEGRLLEPSVCLAQTQDPRYVGLRLRVRLQLTVAACLVVLRHRPGRHEPRPG